MAYSKELESVIEAALADGVLTDKERAVLHKKALLEGVDPDELDVVIEGRLAKMKREEDWLKPIPPVDLSKTKVGNVMKCPACGMPYEPGTGACPHCGHVFQNVESNHSARVLSSEIAKIREKYRGKTYDSEVEAMNNEIKSFIANFPIPSSKDDFIEFITKLDAGRKVHDYFSHAYNQKYQECVKKAKILFPNDTAIEKAISLTDKWSVLDSMRSFFGTLTSGVKTYIGLLLGIAFCLGMLLFLGETENKDKEINAQYESICAQVDALPIPTEENYDVCAASIKRINWNLLYEGGNIPNKKFENAKIESAEKKVNSYIDLLQMLQSEYIDPQTGRSTMESSGYNKKGDYVSFERNNKYVEHVTFSTHSTGLFD